MRRTLAILAASLAATVGVHPAARAALTQVNRGSETSLGRLLFSPDDTSVEMSGTANSDTYRVDDSADQVYSFPAASVATLLIEIAGHKNANDFGIYDPADPTRRLLIFDGPASPSTASGVQSVTFDPVNHQITIGTRTVQFAGNSFGFYLGYDGGSNDGNYNYILYSEPAKNTLTDDAAKSPNRQGDRLVTFDQWTEVTVNSIPILSGSTKVFDRILAWEDLQTGSDYDYNDMLIGITLVPVPEPSTILAASLVAAAFGSHLLRSRRQTSPASR